MSNNPRKKNDAARAKYNKAKDDMINIENDSNNNFGVLSLEYREYKLRLTTRARKEELHPQYLLYRKYLRLQKVVNQFLANHPIDPPVECYNCYRRPSLYLTEKFSNHGTNDHHFILNLHECRSDEISRGRLFQSISQNNTNVQIYTLCTQCHHHLTGDNTKEHEDCWPGFLWHLLSNSELQLIYHVTIWRFIPFECRHWWIEAVREYFPTIYDTTTINSPSPFFKDVTEDIEEWNTAISSYQLPELSRICNKLLIPTVLCPWGCSTFKHKVGSISIDIVIQRYIEKCNIQMIDNSKLKKIKWARDDFLRDEDDQWDAWLMNDNWRILPSVAFINNNLVVLTCEDHNGGSNEMMIHPCRWEHHLPAKQSDQLAPLVVQCRVVKPAKAKKFSDEWQMLEQCGTFSGLETCNHVQFGRFGEYSILRFDAEARSIYSRFDIDAHLNVLCENNMLSRNEINDMRIHAERFAVGRNFTKLYHGGTYVPFDIAIAYQRAARDHSCTVIIRNDQNNINREVTFRKIWNDFLYPCQKVTAYGAQFVTIPAFRSKVGIDTMLIWKISVLLTQVDVIWKRVVQAVRDDVSWHGWLLVYLTKNCFSINRKQDRRDPFKNSQMSSIEKVVSKLPPGLNLRQLIGSLDYVEYLNITPNEIENDFLDVIDNAISLDSQAIVISLGLLDDDIVMVDEILKIDDIQLELRCLISVQTGVGNKWFGEIYSRHGKHFQSYWYQKRSDVQSVQSQLPSHLLLGYEYILVYARCNEFNFGSYRNELLRLIGGQSHVQCQDHRLPIIMSYERNRRCQCGKKELYCCHRANCNVVLCKKCFERFNENQIHYVLPVQNIESDDDTDSNFDNESHRQDEESDSDSDEEPRSDDFIYDDEDDQNLLNRDSFDDYLTSSKSAGIINDDNHEDSEDEFPFIPTTDAGELAVEIDNETEYGGIGNEFKINGSVILNQCGSLLTRKTHELKGSSYHKHFLQRMCATTTGSSIPLLYPEGMLFPSIHWKAAEDKCSIVGAIPSSLLNEAIKTDGFASIQEHIRTRLTFPSAATSTDPNYIAHCYDMMVNLSATHGDTRVILNRGLTVGEDKVGGLGMRGTKDSALEGTIDSSYICKGLCASQKYIKWSHFATYTDNQKKHFGTAPIREWIDRKGWSKSYPDYVLLPTHSKEEIDTSMRQSAAGVMLRVWEEVSKLFMDYLKKSKYSPFKKVGSLFGRKEYQPSSGNVSHTHLILEVLFHLLTVQERAFVEDLIRASVLDIVRPDEINKFIEDGVFVSKDDVHDVIADGISFLTHQCNSRCLVKSPNGELRCRMPDYFKLSRGKNTIHQFVDLPLHISEECWKRLSNIGLANEPFDEHGNQNQFKSRLEFFHPKRYVPPVNPNEDKMSPVDGYTFSCCRSMQNVQRLTAAGGCCKYCCKYIGKIDQQNYSVVSMSGRDGKLVTKSNFLHNTKVSSSKIREDTDREARRDKKHPQGRCIGLMEMLHNMLRYPECYTDLTFVNIPTVPLELRAGIVISTDKAPEDGAYTTSVSNHIRLFKQLDQWRQHTENELLIFDDLKQSNLSIDKITQYCLRPPEFRKTIDMVGHYYRWFYIQMNSKLDSVKMDEMINQSLEVTWWVDGLQRQVKLRKIALSELMDWCDYIENDNDENIDGVHAMIEVFRKIFRVTTIDPTELSHDEAIFLCHANENLLYINEKEESLPIPVFSYIKPSMGIQFLHHILLSLGRFETEIDLILHPTIRESFRYAKLIGSGENEDELLSYSYRLSEKFIEKQLRYFPNSMRVLDSYIVISGELFDSTLVNDELPITEMPPVQLSTLLASREEESVQYKQRLKSDIIDACFNELGPLVDLFNIPSKVELLNAFEVTIQWNPVESLLQTDTQSDASFEEQTLWIGACCQQIDSYSDITNQTRYTKNFIFRGSPGSGKTFCLVYCTLYAISKGLNVMTTAMMAKRALQLGGIHWHVILCLPTERNLTPHRRAELAILKLMRDPKKIDFLRSLNSICGDEFGQISSELFATFDMIFRTIRNSNMFFGGVLILGTLDHLQIQPIDGRPFLTSNSIISCFKMAKLDHSVRGYGDEPFLEIQRIARNHHRTLNESPELIARFRQLCSDNFTFVDNWDDPAINASTFRLFSKRVPALDAAQDFNRRVHRQYANTAGQLLSRISIDTQKMRFAHEWSQAVLNTTNILEQKVKEPRQLLFFKGAIYECTFNQENKFSQSQKALLFEMPSQDDLNQWKKIKVLLAPPGCKEVLYDPNASKEQYLDEGYIERTIGCAPDRIQNIANNTQAQRKQYGLRHYVAGTIHSVMGDTLMFIAIAISKYNTDFSLWDKGQLIVILSRTKRAKNTIFVGEKQDTLNALVELLLHRTQWTDYMEDVLSMVDINPDNDIPERQRVFNQETFPYRIADISLPDDNTGYVYMLLSVKRQDYVYIGKTNNLIERLRAHNSGNGSSSTEPSHLRPYALYAYICGFDSRNTLMLAVENQWKRKRDQLIRRQVTDPKAWARAGQEIIDHRRYDNHGLEDNNDLRLILLFR